MKRFAQVFFLMLSIAFFVTGCCHENYYVIPEKDRIQCEVFDTIIFESNLKNVDTMFISSVNQFMDADDLYDECKNWFQSIHVSYYKIKNDCDSSFLYVAQRIRKEDKEFVTWAYNKAMAELIEDNQKFTVRGKVYKGCWKFSLDGKIIILNSDFGIISYETEEGEKFELKLYIRAN